MVPVRAVLPLVAVVVGALCLDWAPASTVAAAPRLCVSHHGMELHSRLVTHRQSFPVASSFFFPWVLQLPLPHRRHEWPLCQAVHDRAASTAWGVLK